MKKSIIQILILSIFITSAHAQFGLGGLLGGKGKKDSGGLMSKGDFLNKGGDLLTRYTAISVSFAEVAEAQAIATGDLAKAEKIRSAINAANQSAGEKTLKPLKQINSDLSKDFENNEKNAVKYSEEGKKALQKTFPKAALSSVGGALLVKDSVDWFKEFPDQVKAAGFTGAMKLKKDASGALFVAKNVATDIPSWLKALKLGLGYAKKQGVDTSKVEKQSKSLFKDL